jgi:hypothetical protein
MGACRDQRLQVQAVHALRAAYLLSRSDTATNDQAVVAATVPAERLPGAAPDSRTITITITITISTV